MTRPTAAPAIWPYPHRTIAEVDAAEKYFGETEQGANNRQTPIISRGTIAAMQLAKELASQNRTRPEGVRAV